MATPNNSPSDADIAASAAKPVAKPVAKPAAKPAGKAVPPQKPSAASSNSAANASEEPETPRRSAGWLAQSSGLLVSVVVHIAALLVLALWFLPIDLPPDLGLFASPDGEEYDDFEEIPELDFEPLEVDEPVDFEMQPETDNLAEEVDFSAFEDATAAPSFNVLSEVSLVGAPTPTPTDIKGFDGTGTTGRGKMARTAMARKYGGSAASEQAVENALKWLAEHQNPDGSWSLVHDRHACNGRCRNPSNLSNEPKGYEESRVSGTGLALLPFLGAGQTHKQGKYRKTVDRGLRALVAMGKKLKNRQGISWADRAGNMYAHGIATIALTEAYGMTRDPGLRDPAQAAVNYIIGAQNPKDGGWRYGYQSVGDTSVTGWQIMALKSAYLSDLYVPKEVVEKTQKFLDSVDDEYGARYSYLAEAPNGGKPRMSRSMTAVGLLCRMYLGREQEHPGLMRGVMQLGTQEPDEHDYYFNYYATQVIFQHTGGKGLMWRQWNRKMRDQLVEQQATTGHEKGSWYVEGRHNPRGGRLYMTAMATMSLEIYYRYMPIYGESAVDEEL